MAKTASGGSGVAGAVSSGRRANTKKWTWSSCQESTGRRSVTRLRMAPYSRERLSGTSKAASAQARSALTSYWSVKRCGTVAGPATAGSPQRRRVEAVKASSGSSTTGISLLIVIDRLGRVRDGRDTRMTLASMVLDYPGPVQGAFARLLPALLRGQRGTGGPRA